MSNFEVNGNVSNNLGNSGAPIQIKIGNHEVVAKYIDQKVKSGLEQMLIKRAKEDLHKQKTDMSDDEFATVYSNISDRIISGYYSFGSKLSQNWLQTINGIASLLSICTNVNRTEDWETLLLEYPLESNMLLKGIMDGSFPNLHRAPEVKTE